MEQHEKMAWMLRSFLDGVSVAGLNVRRVRLASGLVLFSYLATHLCNHALGLVSLEAMEAGRSWFLALWRSKVGTIALYGSLGVHVLLALWSLYRRRHLRMPAWEAIQLLLGLAIPPLLAGHVVGTRLAFEWFDATDSYTRVVLALWVLRPALGARQASVLLVAWLHGCIGLHYWLRLKVWYPRAAPLAYAGALLLPVLALLGFAHAGREVSALAREPGWVSRTLQAMAAPDLQERVTLERAEHAILGGFAGAILLVLLARAGRHAYHRRSGRVRLTYPGGQQIVVPAGMTVLEISRFARIPHASVCGGRGRCSTCRVRIVQGLESLPPASPEEARVLKRVGAPPNVRLACQLRPSGDLSIAPLVAIPASASDGFPRPAVHEGQETEVAVLFADLRGFTKLGERKLPYDLVFFLNSYFEAVGGAIERAGGVANQFTGDGVMALFGVNADPQEGCRRALEAAGALVDSVAALSQTMAGELAAPLTIGIGIHVGPAVVGKMGYGVAAYLTAVGDTVHVASRLEALTKEYQCQLVVSEQVASRAGVDLSAFPRHEVAVRNRNELLAIRVIGDPRILREALRHSPALPPEATPRGTTHHGGS